MHDDAQRHVSQRRIMLHPRCSKEGQDEARKKAADVVSHAKQQRKLYNRCRVEQNSVLRYLAGTSTAATGY